MIIKRQCIAVIYLLTLVIGLTACDKNYLKEDEVDAYFEQDYEQINDVTSYLLSLEESTVYIEWKPTEIKGRFGKPMLFQSSKIEEIVEELEKAGYHCIEKTNNVVIFDIWRKPFKEEFEAGFVYSVDGTGDLSAVQFLTYQRPLLKENWYYYESDYNEWRVNQNQSAEKTGDE